MGIIEMMNFYGWVVFLHVIIASVFVVTMIIMQFVMSGVMRRIPESSGKQSAQLFLQERWHPIVDVVIVVLGFTGLSAVLLNTSLISFSVVLQVKVFFGSLSLLAAYSTHFYFRYKKRELAKSGLNNKRLDELKKLTAFLDKVALFCGIGAALIGWYMNHV